MKLAFRIAARLLLPLLVLVAFFAVRTGLAEEKEEFTNLKVFPKDVDPKVLRSTMNSFTRALGVRCIFCHVGQEGRPFQKGEFAKDDKPTKIKARVMMQMTRDLNDKYLSTLTDRADPAIQVRCFTCHHGVTQPRTLQDQLQIAYTKGGMDSTRARYAALRDKYYGSAAYDFGEVPLADAANTLMDSGRNDDAKQLFDLNVQMNPNSMFARRQFAHAAILLAFSDQKGDSGAAAYEAMKARFGPTIMPEGGLNGMGFDLMEKGKTENALAVFKLNVAEHPTSGNTYDSMAEAYEKLGDKKNAIVNYQKAAALDSTNTHALDQLKALHAKPLKKKRK